MPAKKRSTGRKTPDYYLNEKKLLWKLFEGKLSLLVRLSQTLSIGHAAAIGTSIVVIKDLAGRFDEHYVLHSTIFFVIGLVLSGLGYLLVLLFDERVRNEMVKSIVGRQQITKTFNAVYSMRILPLIAATAIAISTSFFAIGVFFFAFNIIFGATQTPMLIGPG